MSRLTPEEELKEFRLKYSTPDEESILVFTSEASPEYCPKGHIIESFGKCTQDCFEPQWLGGTIK